MKATNNISKLIIITFILTFICSCKKELNEELVIKYENYTVYMKSLENTDAILPPVFHLNFTATNLTNCDKIFTAKSNIYDNTKSMMYILDTLKNKMIPLFSADRQFMKSNEIIKIRCDINVRDFKEYFGLTDEYLHRIDFESEKKNLDKIYSEIINRSIIIYIPVDSDVASFKLQNEKVTKFRNNTVIKIINLHSKNN